MMQMDAREFSRGNGAGGRCGLAVLILLSILLIVVGGALLLVCRVCMSGATQSVHISPDGKTVAYVWFRALYLPLPPEVPVLKKTEYLGWCSLDKPTDQRLVRIHSVGKGLTSLVNPTFSPDSKHIAVAGPDGLLVIDVPTGKQWRPSAQGELVSSLVWLSGDETAYAAHTNRRGKFEEITDRTFWRQKIHDPPQARVKILDDAGCEVCPKEICTSGWPLERWSPDGRYAIFRKKTHGAQFCLLNVSAGNVRTFGQPKSYTEGISWKPDGSAAVCASQVVGGSGACEVLLLDPATGQTRDLSRNFAEVFGEFSLDLEPLWTPDGQYVIVNSLRRGGCLVRPEPWEVVPIAERLLEHLGREEERAGYIFPQAVTGWVRCWVGGSDYAVDYAGETFVTIGSAGAPGCGWPLSPDGKQAVNVDGSNNVMRVNITLPAPKLQTSKQGEKK